MTLLEMFADENNWQEKEDGLFGLCKIFSLNENEKPWEFFQRLKDQINQPTSARIKNGRLQRESRQAF